MTDKVCIAGGSKRHEIKMRKDSPLTVLPPDDDRPKAAEKEILYLLTETCNVLEWLYRATDPHGMRWPH